MLCVVGVNKGAEQEQGTLAALAQAAKSGCSFDAGLHGSKQGTPPLLCWRGVAP